MRHPLAGFGYYGGNADYSSRGINNVDADFSMTNEVSADEDFGKNCCIGDFGTYGREGEYGDGFEGFGHVDHFYGYYDGLGVLSNPPSKFSAKSVKMIADKKKQLEAELEEAKKIVKPVKNVALPYFPDVAKPIINTSGNYAKVLHSPETLNKMSLEERSLYQPVPTVIPKVEFPATEKKEKELLKKIEQDQKVLLAEKLKKPKSHNDKYDNIKKQQKIMAEIRDSKEKILALKAAKGENIKAELAKTSKKAYSDQLLSSSKFKQLVADAKKIVSKDKKSVEPIKATVPSVIPVAAVTPKVESVPTIKKEEIKKVTANLKKISDITKKNNSVPKTAKKLAKKAKELVKKSIVPAAAVTSGVSILPSAPAPSMTSTSSEVITVQDAIEEQIDAKDSSSQESSAIVVNSTLTHPLLLIHRRFKGETMSGILDDLYKKQKKIVQTAIDQNKEKAIKAATTQATNIIGKKLDKLSKTNPKAQQAITKVVASATQTATEKAKESLAQSVKSSFDEYKKYIILAGGSLVGLLALKMIMGRKA